MNYRHIYMLIISRAKSEQEKGLRPKGRYAKSYSKEYFEWHHILPRSLFPNWIGRKTNIVPLSAREHFFCHQLLVKIYPNSFEMKHALYCFVNFARYKDVVDSKSYEKLKKEYSALRKTFTGEKNSNYGHTWSTEMRERISKLNKGRKLTEEQKAERRLFKWWTNGKENIRAKECPEGFWKGRVLSEKAKQSMKKAGIKRRGRAAWNKGKKMSKEWIMLHSGNYGKSMSTAQKQKISQTLKNRNANLTEEEKRQRSAVLKIAAQKALETKRKNGKLKLSEETKEKIRLAAQKRPKGRKWYNNGKIEKMLFEKPLGWLDGRLEKSVRKSMN